eukprot:TRINITY_DN13643_c0_g1_i1.p1 TRINITY_DN13643_c0_g1~~TRINITY_DN13643_c0_g1_i1.p1  ORF type:complete len:136 (+),score=20.51 TRINITY_DN13643_c0_g1_i1:133-540(+)
MQLYIESMLQSVSEQENIPSDILLIQQFKLLNQNKVFKKQFFLSSSYKTNQESQSNLVEIKEFLTQINNQLDFITTSIQYQIKNQQFQKLDQNQFDNLSSIYSQQFNNTKNYSQLNNCLLYTSDAADEEDSEELS